LVVDTLPDDTPDTLEDNPRIVHRYDANNRRIESTDPDSNATKFVYDIDGQLIEQILPDRTPADDDNPRYYYEYDLVGRKTAEINPRGFRTTFAYNSLSLVSQLVEAN